MLNLKFLVGWIPNFRQSSKLAEFKEKEEISPREAGFNFEHEEIIALMKRLKGFESVEFLDAKGAILTPEIIKNRFGPDGGVDCVIHIVTPTERGASNVATRIRNILERKEHLKYLEN